MVDRRIQPHQVGENPLVRETQVKTGGREVIQAAFKNAEDIYPTDMAKDGPDNSCADTKGTVLDGTAASRCVVDEVKGGGRDCPDTSRPGNSGSGNTSESIRCPIVPLGHKNGLYFFISASGELRSFKAEALEAGRGVLALFKGVSREAEAWCRSNFSTADNDWSHKEAGRWIIKNCNTAGVFDPSTADLRSIGVWRDQNRRAIAHCGNMLAYPEGHVLPLSEYRAKHIMVGAAPISLPADDSVDGQMMSEMLEKLRDSWGWKRRFDVDIFFGWVAAACLGGFPDWRAHLYVHGCRGSGKSKLMELVASLLGDLAGDVINDATEAGLRQSRNNQARPVLIDEFEPDENARNGAKQDSMFALFRRMSGGAGGRISRGGADHSSVSFRTLGAAYVTSINHIHLEPQDRSRFVMLELGRLPDTQNPLQAAALVRELEGRVCAQSPAVFRRMLDQSPRWDVTHAIISAEARHRGADARQADTLATILSGRDLALFDDDICGSRLRDLNPILLEMLGDASEADVTSEGVEALEYLLTALILLDHGVRRSVRELLKSAITETPLIGAVDASGALDRVGVHVLQNKDFVAVGLGKTSQVARLYIDSKWRNGAHGSALLKVEGVIKPKSAVRLSRNLQKRVILIPFECLRFESDENL